LDIQSEDLENRQTQLTIELPDDRVDSAMRSAARRLGKNTRIHGFRPGKAPFNVLLSKLGEDVIFEEALDQLGQEIYREALDESEIEPYAPGSLDEVVSREPLILRYTVPLAPEVDIGDYREIRIDHEESKVEDDAVDQYMEDLRQRQALIEPVERPIQMGDVAVVDISGELKGEETENSKLLDEKGFSVLVDEEYDWPVPGIAGHIEGLEADQEKSFEHTFPEEYASEEMRGKTADFHVLVKEVKSRFVPEWTDDLAKNVGDFDDLLSLRIQVRSNLETEAERQHKAAYATKVLDALVENSTVEYPPVLLRNESQDMVRELEQRLRTQNLSLEDYLKIEGKSEEELLEDMEPQAVDRLKRALVLGKVVEREEIEVEESDIDIEIDRLVSSFENEPDKESARKVFDNPVGRQRINLDLISDKAIERLMSIAKGEADSIEQASEEVSLEAEEVDASMKVEEKTEELDQESDEDKE
jgi:trigger factor